MTAMGRGWEEARLFPVPVDADRAAGAHEVTREGLAAVRAALTERRAEKRRLERVIRDLVEQEETLKQALGVFDRRAAATQNEMGDGDAPTGEQHAGA